MVIRPSATTLYLYPASNSPLVLVIRRGPSKLWHFLTWDRDTGELTFGSWFNGMLYPHRCDLSPRGDAMLILAYRGAKEPVAWTALCRPPAAQALVFWQQKTTKFGGGFFDGRLPIAWINLDPSVTLPDVRQDCGVEFGYLEDQAHLYGGAIERLERDGWKAIPLAGTRLRFMKRSPKKDHELIVEFDGPANGTPLDFSVLQNETVRYYVRASKKKDETLLDDVTWANWNSHGELCLAAQGRLLYANPAGYPTLCREVIDLNGLQPRDRTSSYASGA